MYETHWGLRESPFRGGADRRFFFQSPTHDEALARLQFLVENDRRLAVLTGQTGVGKSMLLRLFADQLRQQGIEVALVNLIGLPAEELVWTVADQLHAGPAAGDPMPILWRKISDRLVAQRYQQLKTVVLFDDAGEAAVTTRASLVRLIQSDTSGENRLTVVLSTTPDRVDQLGSRLLDLSELRIELETWAADDVADFLQSSLDRAGRRSPIFVENAANKLHALGEGIPRNISQLAELSLLAGAGRQAQSIDGETVESVFHQLSVNTG